MLLARHLRRHRATWLSGKLWRGRLVFTVRCRSPSALRPCLFAQTADLAAELFGWLRDRWPYLPLLLTPARVRLVRLDRPALVRRCRRAVASRRRSPPGAHAIRRIANSLLGARVTIGKVALTVAGLAVGASIGREGPTVQVGRCDHAGRGQLRWRRTRARAGRSLVPPPGLPPPSTRRWPVSCSRIEEMAKEFEHRISGPIIGAVVLAGITGLALVGDYRYFGQTTAVLDSAQDWLAVPLCGIVGGLLGGLFSLGVVTMATRRHGLVAALKSWPVCFAASLRPRCRHIGPAHGWVCQWHGLRGTRIAGARHGHAVVGCAAEAGSDTAFLGQRHSWRPVRAVALGRSRPRPALATVLPTLDLRALSLLAMVAYFAGVVQAPADGLRHRLGDERRQSHGGTTHGDGVAATGASRLVCPPSPLPCRCRGNAVRRIRTSACRTRR